MTMKVAQIKSVQSSWSRVRCKWRALNTNIRKEGRKEGREKERKERRKKDERKKEIGRASCRERV